MPSTIPNIPRFAGTRPNLPIIPRVVKIRTTPDQLTFVRDRIFIRIKALLVSVCPVVSSRYYKSKESSNS